jgi:hypothetical protein
MKPKVYQKEVYPLAQNGKLFQTISNAVNALLEKAIKICGKKCN